MKTLLTFAALSLLTQLSFAAARRPTPPMIISINDCQIP
jgi:hypothetical protein